MDNRSIDSEHSPKEVTAVITRNIKPGHEKDYDEWLRRYMMLENKVPGYLGTTIIAPGGKTSSVRYIINRFSDKESMDAQFFNNALHVGYGFRDLVLCTRFESYSCSS
jgi:antibiotic biosynthesis monooxygenase (ABM) superfamily enzyme